MSHSDGRNVGLTRTPITGRSLSKWTAVKDNKKEKKSSESHAINGVMRVYLNGFFLNVSSLLLWRWGVEKSIELIIISTNKPWTLVYTWRRRRRTWRLLSTRSQRSRHGIRSPRNKHKDKQWVFFFWWVTGRLIRWRFSVCNTEVIGPSVPQQESWRKHPEMWWSDYSVYGTPCLLTSGAICSSSEMTHKL